MTSGGNNVNDFHENQLIIDFAFLCKPTWWNATVSPFLLDLISFGGKAFHEKFLRKRRSPSTTPLGLSEVNAVYN